MWQMTIQIKGNYDLAGEMLMAAVDGESISVLRAEGAEGAEKIKIGGICKFSPPKNQIWRA